MRNYGMNIIKRLSIFQKKKTPRLKEEMALSLVIGSTNANSMEAIVKILTEFWTMNNLQNQSLIKAPYNNLKSF